MMIVLDTSAAVDLVLHPAQREKESDLLADAKWVLAPTLFVSEVANVFWKYHAFHHLPQEQAEQAMELAQALPDALADDRELYTEAFAMACRTGHPVHDMLYLVLARRNNALLMTRDQALKKLAAKHDVRV